MVDLSLLLRPQCAEYRVDAGDVLAVYIENILGRPDMPPINQSLDPTRPPTLGYPLTVRDDGTLAVPRFGPIPVRGKSIPEVEAAIRYAFTYQRRFMQPGQNNRVVVSLHMARQHRILVVRQESQTDVLTGINIGLGSLGTTKKGYGKIVSLPAYKNDVMHALVESGGLPGLDAKAVVWVIRAKKEPRRVARASYNQPQFPPIPYSPYGTNPNMPYGANPNMPYRLQPNLPVIMGPVRRYPAPTSVAPNSKTFAPNDQSRMAPGAGVRQPMMNPMPTNRARVAPNRIPNQVPMNSAPTAQRLPSSGGIQQASYEIMATPRQIAENLTGIPMPPRMPAEKRDVVGPINRTSSNVAAALNQMIPGHIRQSACSTCQNGPAASMRSFGQVMTPVPYGNPMQPMPYSSGPMMPQWQPPTTWNNVDAIARGGLCNQSSGQTIRIPLRLSAGEAIRFSPQDVILEDGDIVFIQSREDEVFYTGGLLGGSQFSLPRDSDLDILEAIAIAQSQDQSQAGRRSALNSHVTVGASQVIIIRKLPNGSQVPIMVNLYRAKRHESERIAIRPGDYIILQYTKLEAVGAFLEKHILEGALFGVAAASLGRGG
jgi:protein involved in polysaccharide export with SLBB domain